MFRNLEAELKRNMIKKSELAKAIGITAGTLSMKLNGKSQLTLKEAVEIKDVIDKELSLEYLFHLGKYKKVH